MDIFRWAEKWKISEDALNELTLGLGILDKNKTSSDNKSEGAIQNIIKMEASKKGCRLWRNNVGAVYTAEGAFMRYGLANDSAQMNKIIKSSDLIGIRPLKITHEMVGGIIGQFLSREVKNAKWAFKNTEREKAQLNWINLISSLGGDACFTTGEGTL